MSTVNRSRRSWAEIKAKKRRPRDTVTIVLDADWGAELLDAQREIAQLEQTARLRENDPTFDTQVTELQAKISTLLAMRDDSVQDFVMRAVSGPEYDRLVTDNRPTAEQRAAAVASNTIVLWNDEEFGPALVHASLMSPEMTLDEVRDMWTDDEWTPGDRTLLFQCAHDLAMRQLRVPTVKAPAPAIDGEPDIVE